MCIAYPARILGFDASDAIVDMGGRRRKASMLMRPQVAVGDWVLVGAGSVLRPIDAAEATALARTLDAAMAATDSQQARDPRRTAEPPGGPR